MSLITYVEKHQAEIIDYERRQKAGKPIGSGRMEKAVDQVIGARQKSKDMSWSPMGSKALGILKVVELNGVTSEATSIYDPKNSLFVAYRVLDRKSVV